MRKAFVVAAVALQCLTGSARSQDASPDVLAAATELASIISADTIKQLSETMTAQVWPKLQAQFASRADPATLAELKSAFERELARFLTDVTKDAPTLYARHFTAQELRDIAAFYRTPSGRKALEAMPKVTAESFALIMPRMKNFQRDLDIAVQDVLKRKGAR